MGLYQHDIKAGLLANELSDVVESAVNFVGVDLNTASPALLTHVAGLSSTVARKVVQHRADCGAFRSRQEIRDVKGVGPKTFEQCAGEGTRLWLHEWVPCCVDVVALSSL